MESVVVRVLKVRPMLNREWYVLIIPTEDSNSRDFYLGHERYGVQEFMFGCDVENDDEALALVELNVNEYMKDYVENYI